MSHNINFLVKLYASVLFAKYSVIIFHVLHRHSIKEKWSQLRIQPQKKYGSILRAIMARHTTNPISRQLAKYNRIALIRFASDIMGETLNLQTCRYSAVLGYVIHRLD